MKPKISIIVAAAQSVIGCSDGLPWKIPEELQYFKSITNNKPVIMGRKTFQSLKGGPLKNRKNIVLTRGNFEAEGVVIKNTLADAIQEALSYAKENHIDEIMIIGGSDIFKQSFPLADKVYLTKIHGEFEGNAYLEGFEQKDWVLKNTTSKFLLEKQKKEEIRCDFMIFEKIPFKNSKFSFSKILNLFPFWNNKECCTAA